MHYYYYTINTPLIYNHNLLLNIKYLFNCNLTYNN